MGLATVVVTGILIIALMAASFLIVGEVLRGVTETSDAFKTVHENRLDKMNTRIQIEEVSTEDEGGYLNLYVLNAGSTKISDFDKMDVVIYGEGWAEWIPHADGSYLVPNGWRVKKICNDVLNPGILDPGEEMIIEVYPSHISYLIPDSNNWVKIITPNGAEGIKYFRGG